MEAAAAAQGADWLSRTGKNGPTTCTGALYCRPVGVVNQLYYLCCWLMRHNRRRWNMSGRVGSALRRIASSMAPVA